MNENLVVFMGTTAITVGLIRTIFEYNFSP